MENLNMDTMDTMKDSLTLDASEDLNLDMDEVQDIKELLEQLGIKA